ncbi:PTS system, fructose-specific IIC-like component [Pilibacter termitis]|uniref:PTS system, fructose-specific IIC-like component n=1 Tax=Pilibacter termitis TaxID=263852 RepID=A0A1T4K0H2_9ENTE|nr:PTS fructose transporter subunit EIIC [Pilibacter termitis]SJZ35913.1 PTS system, fructose-specific IIC-like component [Pilibacter termitis]
MRETIDLLKDTRKHLMTGVSYMIPFVVAGGILLAVSVLLTGNAAVPSEGILADIANIGIAGLGIMVPILSGYIAFSMADRPGLAPGVIGGIVASNLGAGFIGGIFSGILAGIVVTFLKKIKLSSNLRSLMPIFVIPLSGTLIVGGLMYWVLGKPIAFMMKSLTSLLEGMGTGNLVLLGLVLGAMIAVDMGGPINKVAFSFGTAMVGTIDKATGMPSATALTIMAGIGVAICVPPLAMGVATIVAPKKFTVEEKNSGKAALVMGMVGITEGAIPFAASDPLHVIPANIAGGAVGASLAMLLGAGNPAPWGGWIVLPVAVNPFMYVIATLGGVAVTTGMVVLLKSKVEETEQTLVEEEDFDLDISIL